MTGFLVRLVLAGVLGAVLNIWLVWYWALVIALVVVFGGFLIITNADELFD